MRFSNYKGLESRAYVRVPAELQVAIFSGNGDGQLRRFDGVTRNISAGGMCVELDEYDKAYWKGIRDPSPPVELSMLFPRAERSVNARGEVRWVAVKKGKPPVMMLGLHFLGMDNLGKSMLVNMIERKYLLDFKALTGR